MSDFDQPTARVGAPPWRLYQSDITEQFRRENMRDGFYTGMLKQDLRTQRYAYEMSLAPHAVEWSTASAAIFGLLNDFNHTGYDREPVSLICDFVAAVLEEAAGGETMLLELFALPDESNRAKASQRYERSGDEEDPVSGLPSLGWIPRWSVTQRRRGLVQVPIEKDAPPTLIPASTVHDAVIRDQNLKIWKRAIGALRKVDEVKSFGAFQERMDWDGYSFTDQVGAQNLAVGAVTAAVGWDARGTFAESVTTPYMIFRRLRFAHFWLSALEEVESPIVV